MGCPEIVTRQVEAIIIGSGVIGTSIALSLSRLGTTTLNVDLNPAAGYGSTSSSSAIIRTHYSTLPGTLLAWESLLHWKDWAAYLGLDEPGDCASFRNTGVAVLLSGGETQDLWRAHHIELDIPFEEWDLATLRCRLPYLSTASYGPPRRPEDPEFGELTGQEIQGAFYVSEGGFVNDPQLAARNLQSAAQRLGAEFMFGVRVDAVISEGGRVRGVRLADGRRISAPIVVNAAGPHSFQINDMAGVTGDMAISTRPLRHEVHCVPAPPGMNTREDGIVLSDNDIGGYCRPDAGNTLMVGSQDPACDPLEWESDPDHFNREVTVNQWQAQVYRMALRIPGLPIPAHPLGIADLYDVTEDWLPLYDRSCLDGFYMAVGTSGNQFKNAPVVGQLMACLIDACESGHDHDRQPVQFECPHTGRSLNLGSFSRRREINADSSFSVLG